MIAALLLVMPLLGAVDEPLRARTVTLRSPLTTILPVPGEIASGGVRIQADIEVPEDAPADLGVGAYAVDGDGRWFQRCAAGTLIPGRHHLSFEIGPTEPLVSEPERGAWTPASWSTTRGVGLFFWSVGSSRARLTMSRLGLSPDTVIQDQRGAVAEPLSAHPRLGDCRIDGMDSRSGSARVQAGARWTISVQPQPSPANPYDPDEFALDALITTPDGTALTIPGFFEQPLTLVDRGDREESLRSGTGSFAVRFRPWLPGRYRVRLVAAWRCGARLVAELPPLDVAGPARDEVARVDALDPRFFSAAGRMVWPVGPNLHSVYDLRSCAQLGTRATPDRGWFAYAPRLDRLAAAGATATEVWLSNWNLGLEWCEGHRGFAGLGRYHEANAARLDALLDRAWADGVRVNLVIQNHGQASIQINSDWAGNPYNRANGGPLDDADELFTAPAAIAGQERLRRYLVARYADHPAVLGWKLWSEVNLTAGANQRGLRPPDNAPAEDGSGHDALRTWHERAAARWHALDVYRHPVTTHFSGDYRRVYPDIAALPGIDFICFNAYHRALRGGAYAMTLAELLSVGILDRESGVGRFAKPALVTEYGGTSSAAAEPLMRCEQASGAWLALVTGHAGAPMSWWFEWIEQRGLETAYTAIARFMAGEDLRGARARSVWTAAEGAHGALWARAWARPGLELGYVLDLRWAAAGEREDLNSGITLCSGEWPEPGDLSVEWWDPQDGTVIGLARIGHAGGALPLQAPAFRRHLAYKIRRVAAAGPGPAPRVGPGPLSLLIPSTLPSR